MASPDLCSLPVEMVQDIMTKLDSPEDLFSFIRASKRVLDAFRDNKITVLAAVIRNAIPEDNMDVGVAACRSELFSKLSLATDWIHAPNEALRRLVKDFPGGRRATDYTYSLRDKSLLMELYKLWWNVDGFVTQYAQEALELARKNMPCIDKQQSRPVTAGERMRVQRAFFRIEINRRIGRSTKAIGADGDVTWRHFRCEVQGDPPLLFAWYSPWETEEMLSVHEFLVAGAKDIVRSMRKETVNTLASTAMNRSASSDPSSTVSFPPWYLGPHINWALWELYWAQVFRYIIGRGLPFLRQLSRMHLEQTLSFFRNPALSYSGTPSILHVIMTWAFRREPGVGWADRSYPDALADQTEGWRWAESCGLATGPDALLDRHALRQRGYIFWDKSRLHEHWRLPLTSPTQLQLARRSAFDDDRVWEDDPGVGESFRHIPIPRGTFDKDTEARIMFNISLNLQTRS